MHRRLFLLIVFLPDATFSATADGGCNGQCGSTSVPYPFGFSGDCPVLLDGNAAASTPLLPNIPAASPPYAILSFNAAAFTFIVSLPPLCGRRVSEATAALNGPGYGVTNRTEIFLVGGCRTHGATTNCSFSADAVTSVLLRTAGCGGKDNAWACMSSQAANSTAAARGKGQFLQWEAVEDAGREDVLTSAVYGYDTTEGVPSVEFGIAVLGWWLDGTCNSTAANASATAVHCAQNATCHDVETPSGAWGHRCTCPDGMVGDGCHYGYG